MEVMIQTLCNNLTKFLAQQTSPAMASYICEAIRKYIIIFRISLVVFIDEIAKGVETSNCLSGTLGRV